MFRLKKIFKSRKSQFYILTALVLVAYATLMVKSDSPLTSNTDNFKQAYENFAFESHAAINNALFEDEFPGDEVELFVDNFNSYAKTKTLNVEVFYILEHKGLLYFSNNMDTPVRLININQTLYEGEQATYTDLNFSELGIEIRDDIFHENIYKFSLSDEDTDIKAVLRIKKGDEREIFVLE